MASEPLNYRDFKLELTDLAADGTFKVRTVDMTPGGEMRVGQAETVQYKPEDFKLGLLQLEKRRLNQAGLIELGEKLGALLLPGRVGQLFEDSLKALGPGEGLRLRLRIEPLPLAALPWEYAYRPAQAGGKEAADFLALRPKVSITRYETTGEPAKPFEGKKARIVAALASPIDQDELQLEQDRLAIENAIAAMQEISEQAKRRVELEVIEAATRADLNRALPGADIFQFSGHGVFEGTELNEDGQLLKRGKLLLETKEHLTDPFDNSLLAALLRDSPVRLVVLGACNSAARDEGGAWSGIAPALARAEAPAVVAMQYKVRDVNAAAFLAEFYHLLLHGYSLDEAVQRARLVLFASSGLEDRDWGTPVVYLRAENSFLFAPESAGERQPGGIFVDQEVESIAGEVIGLRARRRLEESVRVNQRVRRVEQGGSLIGVDLDQLPAARDSGDFDEPRD